MNWLATGIKIEDWVMRDPRLLCPRTARDANRAVESKKNRAWKNDTACNTLFCPYHRKSGEGASFCIRSIERVPFRGFRVGHQCCYDKDGQFMRDTKFAGTADLAPSPYLAHRKHDMDPSKWCCAKDSNMCHRYYDYRPFGYVVGE